MVPLPLPRLEHRSIFAAPAIANRLRRRTAAGERSRPYRRLQAPPPIFMA